MDAQTKTVLKTGVISGLLYAGIMVGFDLLDEQDFKWWKFIFNTLFFGAVMGFLTLRNLKKQEKHKD